MNFFKRIFNKTEETPTEVKLSEINEFFERKATNYNTSDLSEVTYFTCLKILSESIGKLNVHLKDDNNDKVTNDLSYVLTVRPNQYMSPSTFFATMEFYRNHYGNAYALIRYSPKGELLDLLPLHPTSVGVVVDDTNLYNDYYYTYNGEIFDKTQILHFKSGLGDGVVGKPIRETLATTFLSGKESQRILNELYKDGLTASAVIKYTGDLNDVLQQKLARKVQAQATNGNKFVTLPIGVDLEPLKVSFKDTEFSELRKYNSLQIGAVFGIKPNYLNDYSKSSYANSESQNLSFYTDTLLFILKHYEEELNYKLLTRREINKGLKLEFNVHTILRGDIKSQADYLSKLVPNTVYTVNEARKYIGLNEIKNGDTLIANGSYVSLDNLGIAYAERAKEEGDSENANEDRNFGGDNSNPDKPSEREPTKS